MSLSEAGRNRESAFFVFSSAPGVGFELRGHVKKDAPYLNLYRSI